MRKKIKSIALIATLVGTVGGTGALTGYIYGPDSSSFAAEETTKPDLATAKENLETAGKTASEAAIALAEAEADLERTNAAIEAATARKTAAEAINPDVTSVSFKVDALEKEIEGRTDLDEVDEILRAAKLQENKEDDTFNNDRKKVILTVAESVKTNTAVSYDKLYTEVTANDENINKANDSENPTDLAEYTNKTQALGVTETYKNFMNGVPDKLTGMDFTNITEANKTIEDVAEKVATAKFAYGNIEDYKTIVANLKTALTEKADKDLETATTNKATAEANVVKAQTDKEAADKAYEKVLKVYQAYEDNKKDDTPTGSAIDTPTGSAIDNPTKSAIDVPTGSSLSEQFEVLKKENAELTATLTKAENRISTQKTVLADYKDKANEASIWYTGLVSAKADNDKAVQTVLTTDAYYRAELNAATKKYNEAEAQYKTAVASNVAIKVQIENAKAERTINANKQSEYVTIYTSIVSDYDDLKNEAAVLKKSNSNYTKANKKWTARNRALRTKINRLK